jgi:hypothetical protein
MTTKNLWCGEERRVILEDRMSACNKRLTKIPGKMKRDIRKKEKKRIKYLDKKECIVGIKARKNGNF